MKGARLRDTVPLPVAVFAGALTLYAVLVPLGLFRIALAPFVTGAVLMGGPLDAAAASPVALLWAGALARLPLADLPTRLHLASALAGALALAVWSTTLLQVLPALRPRGDQRLPARARWHEPLASVGAVAVVALSPVFAAGAVQAGAVATAAVAFAGGLHLATTLVTAPGDTRKGLALAFACGLSAGVDPLVSAALWPPALLLWLWALRRGERWPLLAPFVFMVGAGVLLVLTALPVEPRASLSLWLDRLTLHDLRLALADASGTRALAQITEIAQDLGVVAAVVSAVGLVVLAWRLPAQAALLIYAGWALVLVGAALPAEGPRVATGQALLALLTAPLLAVGIVHMAGRLGRARLPAAAAMTVMALTSPLLAGGLARWLPTSRLPTALLERAHLRAGPGATVDPGSPEMQRLFEYGAALGLRPDVRVRPAPRER